MIRYQILIEYVGTNFKGWQVQKKGITVQGLLQQEISKILKEKIKVYGSGRTDAGVHAIQQSAHFDTLNEIKDIKKFFNSLNFFINPYQVSLLKLIKKNSNFHARFSAKKRLYKYVIINRTSMPVIEKRRSWHVRKDLDIQLMKKGAQKLLGKKDFSTFRASSCNAKSPIRTMEKATVSSKNNKIIIKFQSQSFLQQQVRSMVGCLKYLGEKKWTLSQFTNVIKSKNRKLCAPPAPAEGLFLERVFY